MKYLRYLTLVGLLMLPLAYSQAQVRVGVGIAFGPPVCNYGYYSYYPYACAPYGYYGPSWFVNGIFIGAGPWYHGSGHGYWERPYYGRGYYDRDHDRFYGRGFEGRHFEGHGFAGRGFEGRGSDLGFHGGGGSHGGGGFHGGGGHGGHR